MVVLGAVVAYRSNGNWIRGFSKLLGSSIAYVAELWSVLGGLELARSQGVIKIELHVDSKMVATSLNCWSIGKQIFV